MSTYSSEDKKGKHTPGPWTTCHNGDCPCGMVWSTTVDRPIAAILSNCRKDEGYNLGEGISNRSEEFKHNYLLVAAAPKMLKALEGIERLRPLIEYPNHVSEEHVSEAMALSVALLEVTEAIKEAKGE